MSFGVTFKRIVRNGFIGFWRNAVVSFSAVFVMTTALLVIGASMLSSVFLQETIKQVEQKVDVNIYFAPTAKPENILALRDEVAKNPQIAEVQYISREQALENFKAQHPDDFLIQQALQELGDNPLGASLNIRAKQTADYQSIAEILQKEKDANPGLVTKITYAQQKQIIEKLNAITSSVQRFAATALFALVVVAVVVTFNTIRIAIYSAREEIGIMRLVGASNMFVRGPFIVEGVLCGMIAAAMATLIFYPVTIWLSQATSTFYGGMDLFQYYLGNLFQFFTLLLFAGVSMGVLSSWLAVRKYLHV
jgi:cell division transport system permease protein